MSLTCRNHIGELSVICIEAIFIDDLIELLLSVHCQVFARLVSGNPIKSHGLQRSVGPESI